MRRNAILLFMILACTLIILGTRSLAMRNQPTATLAPAIYTPLINQREPAEAPPAPCVTTTAGEIATETPCPTAVTVTATAQASLTAIAMTAEATASATNSAAPSATEAGATATSTATATLPVVSPTATATVTPTPGDNNNDVLEPFENAPGSWQVQRDTAGGGSISQSNLRAVAGSFSARLATSNSASIAQLRSNFSEAATDHKLQERQVTYQWQRASLYIPVETVAQLGPDEYLTLAGFWASNVNYGWYLRVRQNGQLYVVGQRDYDNTPIEFQVYGVIPTNRWFSLEIGLHSQAGPGVRRAFSFLIDGDFYGWYHQGRMQGETYNRAAIGILKTNSSDGLELFVDQWRVAGTVAFPTGPDNRSTANLQEQDYRTQSGVQWQIDWTSWENSLRLHPQYGLYSLSNRFQSGRNLDRMPDLSNGWAEIEIDWPNGTPPVPTTTYFGPMVGFRKEINREENLEIIPYRDAADGKIYLVLEAWVGDGLVLARWPMPQAAVGGSAVPEPGDIIRARWEQISTTNLNVRASYYDQSADTWHTDIIQWSGDITNFTNSTNGLRIDYTDGYHTASSITSDSIYYSIRRYKIGALNTYLQP